LNSSSDAFQAIWSLSMSILLTDISSIPPPQAADAGGQLHQSSSGTSSTVRTRGWWNWFDRHDQRISLRDIADDPHLLNDLGLSRDEALREAAKPFWR
jgi:uncharacterized protein YjiS (DUF1127 family)